MLSTLVKISNVTNLSDARYCAGMGVEWIGFSIDEEDPNYVSPKKFNEIKSWLVGVQVLVETAKSIEDIQIALTEYAVDGIQVPYTSPTSTIKEQTDKVLFVTINVDTTAPAEIGKIIEENEADYYVLDSEVETDLADEWKEVIIKHSQNAQLLLGFGVEASADIQEEVAALNLAGIALKGSEEIRPGFKDFGALMDILEQLEEE